MFEHLLDVDRLRFCRMCHCTLHPMYSAGQMFLSLKRSHIGTAFSAWLFPCGVLCTWRVVVHIAAAPCPHSLWDAVVCQQGLLPLRQAHQSNEFCPDEYLAKFTPNISSTAKQPRYSSFVQILRCASVCLANENTSPVVPARLACSALPGYPRSQPQPQILLKAVYQCTGEVYPKFSNNSWIWRRRPRSDHLTI